MSLILNEKYIGKQSSYKLFITNRLLRLFPTYWIVLLLTIIFSIITYQMRFYRNASFLITWIDNYKHLTFSSFFYLAFSNLFLFFQDIALFLGLDTKSGNLFLTSNFYSSNPNVFKFLLVPQAWSISLELIFYIMAPWLVKRSLWLIISLMALSLLIRIAFIKVGMYHDPWNYRFFSAEIFFFLGGSLCYRIYNHIRAVDFLKGNLLILNRVILIILIAFTLSFFQLVKYFSLYRVEAVYFLIFFASVPFIFACTKRSKFDRMIGDLSYPVYLVHILCIGAVGLLHVYNIFVFNGIVITLSILFSLIINKLILVKIERYRQNRLAAKREIINNKPQLFIPKY